MLLRSVSYHQELSLKQYYFLFQDLAKQPLTEQPIKFDYGFEIIDAALDGRINFDKEFNLMGYAHTIEKNAKMKKSKKAKKVLYFVEEDQDENGIAVESIASEKDSYEEYIEKEDLKYSVKKVEALSKEIVGDYDIDIIFAISQALRGIPQAIDSLKEVCESYPKISEYLQVILSSGVPFEELFSNKIL